MERDESSSEEAGRGSVEAEPHGVEPSLNQAQRQVLPSLVLAPARAILKRLFPQRLILRFPGPGRQLPAADVQANTTAVLDHVNQQPVQEVQEVLTLAQDLVGQVRAETARQERIHLSAVSALL